MSANDLPFIRFHEDAVLFREAVGFTAAGTGFPPRLVEKDYFASVMLSRLAGVESLVFKGGTCLAKVHAGFYRLSEDLDFAIPLPSDAARRERSARASGFKKAVASLARRLPVLRVVQEASGANNSTQYAAVAGYGSLLGQGEETVAVELGLREPLLTPTCDGPAGTLLLDPLSGQPWLSPLPARCISLDEAFAEKFRSALTRREPAIRDFHDIDYAVRRLGLRPRAARFAALVRRKLAVTGSEPVDISGPRLEALRRQLEA